MCVCLCLCVCVCVGGGGGGFLISESHQSKICSFCTKNSSVNLKSFVSSIFIMYEQFAQTGGAGDQTWDPWVQGEWFIHHTTAATSQSRID